MTEFERKLESISIKEAADSERDIAEISLAEAKENLLDVTNIESLKRKYGELYQVDTIVEEDDEREGRKLRFVFKRPNVASFNRYLKTASKNMAASTTTFVMDNIIEEQRINFEEEAAMYPGLALGVGTKLLSALGLSDNVNFKKL